MKLLDRIKFVFKYDIDRDFILYSIPDQTAMTFLDYDKAKEFSDGQIQYNPKVMVAIRRIR